MDRNLLIDYSYNFAGEYDRIIKAIKNNEEVKHVEIANCFTIFDECYPKSLLDLKYPPLVIYYKGNLDLLKGDAIGIVGSRIACKYALEATRRLVEKNFDKVIISGLAKGIDYQAHLYANSTIGVLGCGIDYIYPLCNYDLIKRVEQNGLILSEYPSMSKPLGYHFPFRNRIIAALANKIYIMQSTSKSGTMTTINEALELGKQICVLPYDIFDLNGIQNNTLIYEGATPIAREEIAF